MRRRPGYSTTRREVTIFRRSVVNVIKQSDKAYQRTSLGLHVIETIFRRTLGGNLRQQRSFSAVLTIRKVEDECVR